MSPEIRIRTWLRGTADDERRGLLGYLSILYGDLVLDGITLRRTAAGKLTLAYPARTDRFGLRHAYISPIDDRARQQIERVILKGMVTDSTEVAP